MAPEPNRRPDDPLGAARRFAAAMLSAVALVFALAWVLVALRLTREDVGGIESPGMPIALVQFVLAVLGALSAGMGTSRAGWYLKTGRGGPDAAASVVGAAVLFGAWAVLVLPGW